MPVYESAQRGHQSYGESNASGSPYTPNQSRYSLNCDAAQGYAPVSNSYAESDYSPHSPHPTNGAPYSTFGVVGDSGDSRGKKRRGNLPKPVTDILRLWFHEHLDHPYPSEDDKQMLIARTGLSISQISNWFINARRRQLPALRNQYRTQENERGNGQSLKFKSGDHIPSSASSLSPG